MGRRSGYLFPGLRQGPRALDPQCLVTLDVSGSCLLSAGALGASGCGSLRPLGSLLTRTCSSALGRCGLSPLLSVLRPAPSLPGDPRPPGSPPCATTGTSQGRELGGGGTQGTCSCLAGLAVLCRPLSGVFGAAVQCSAIYSRVCVCGREGQIRPLRLVVWTAPRRAQRHPLTRRRSPRSTQLSLRGPQLASRANWRCPCAMGHCRRPPWWAAPAACPDRTRGRASARGVGPCLGSSTAPGRVDTAAPLGPTRRSAAGRPAGLAGCPSAREPWCAP